MQKWERKARRVKINNMQTIYSLNINELENFLETHGQKKYRAKQIPIIISSAVPTSIVKS